MKTHQTGYVDVVIVLGPRVETWISTQGLEFQGGENSDGV